MFKKSVSYLVLSSFLLMDAASCMEPEDNGPSSPRRSPRILIDTSESSEEQNTGTPSSVLENDSVLQQVGAGISAIIDPQERLQAISTLPWDEGKRLYAEFALQENIPLVLRRKAFSSILFTSSLDEVTREGLRVLRTTSLNDEELPLTERIAFLPDLEEEAPPIAMLLSFTRTLESADNEPYNEWDIYKLTSLLMSYDRTESQEGIETCFSKQPKFFLDGNVWEDWLRTTLEMSHESKRVSMLQKIHEVMHSTEDVKKVAATVKFILQYSQDAGDKETALEVFFNIVPQLNASHSEMPREQFLRQKLDINDACKVLLPHVPEDKATLLTTLSEDMLQQVGEGILAIVDPQERLQAISILPWEERNQLYAEFALQEGVPIALRREVFSFIYSTDSLDEATKEGLKNLKTIFLNDETLPFKDRLTFLPNADEEAPPIATLLSLSRALESTSDGSYEEWNVLRLIQLLMDYDRTESQEGVERCFFKQPTFFLDGGTYDEWLRTTLEASEEGKRASILQKIRDVIHSTEDVKKVAAAAKFILQYSQDAGDKETALGAFFSIITQQNVSLSEMPREQFLRQKLDINDACKALLPHVSEDKATLLRTLSDDMLQQVREGISAIIDPQERLQEISRLPWEEGNRPYAEFALQEGIPMALRRKAFSSIYLTYSLDEATRDGLRNLIVTLLNDEELTDPQEILKMISMLPWEEGYQLYAKFALQENIPMALRREAFSFIYSTDSLDETTRERLENLRTAFLSDEEPIDQREGLQAISVPD